MGALTEPTCSSRIGSSPPPGTSGKISLGQTEKAPQAQKTVEARAWSLLSCLNKAAAGRPCRFPWKREVSGFTAYLTDPDSHPTAEGCLDPEGNSQGLGLLVNLHGIMGP